MPFSSETVQTNLLFYIDGASRLHQPIGETHSNKKHFLFYCFMKLIEEELVRLSKEFGNQDNSRDPMVIARYMSTTSPATWLVTDFDPETGEAVAYKTGMTDTGWELLDIMELARIRIPTDTIYYDAASKQTTYRKSFGRIVRDGHFTPRRLSELIPSGINAFGVQDFMNKKQEAQAHSAS